MSDIGILNDPLSLIAIALIFGSPGLLLGGIAVACAPRHRRATRRRRGLRAVASGMDGSQGRDLKVSPHHRCRPRESGDPSTPVAVVSARREACGTSTRSSQASVVMGPRLREDDGGVCGAACPHPLLRLLVFCTRLPWSPCSRMLCFSSSRWPLVVSSGDFGRAAGALVALVVVRERAGWVLVMRGLLLSAG